LSESQSDSESESANSPTAERRPISAGLRWSLVGGAALVVILIDQLSKAWAVDRLYDGSVVRVFWTLQFLYAENTGMAFSKGAGMGPVIGLVAIGISVVVAISARKLRSPLALVLCGIVIGGALGNVIDRASRVPAGGKLMSGAVVDFIDLQWWPVFNVADMAVVCGGIALAVLLVRDPDASAPEDHSETEMPAGTTSSADPTDPADPADPEV
jgi:signal peptidase II